MDSNTGSISHYERSFRIKNQASININEVLKLQPDGYQDKGLFMLLIGNLRIMYNIHHHGNSYPANMKLRIFNNHGYFIEFNIGLNKSELGNNTFISANKGYYRILGSYINKFKDIPLKYFEIIFEDINGGLHNPIIRHDIYMDLSIKFIYHEDIMDNLTDSMLGKFWYHKWQIARINSTGNITKIFQDNPSFQNERSLSKKEDDLVRLTDETLDLLEDPSHPLFFEYPGILEATTADQIGRAHV